MMLFRHADCYAFAADAFHALPCRFISAARFAIAAISFSFFFFISPLMPPPLADAAAIFMMLLPPL